MSKLPMAVNALLILLLLWAVIDLAIDRLNEPSELERKMRREALVDRVKNEYKACRARGEEALFVFEDGSLVCVKK